MDHHCSQLDRSDRIRPFHFTDSDPLVITGPCCLVFSIYFMASSASGQDEPNRALWLATRAGKMEPSCPLGTTRCIPQANFHQKPYNKSFIDQVCSVKMAGYWPRSFFASLWTSTSSWSINTQKKELGQYPADVYKTWTGVHGPPHGPGPWTTMDRTTPNFQKQIAPIKMKIYRRSRYEKHRLVFFHDYKFVLLG